MNAQKKRLGRGLAALIGDDLGDTPVDAGAADGRDGLQTMPLADLLPSPFNPRQHFDEEELRELAQSIAEKGLLQPILVRPAEEPGRYEIVAGERRWRAAQMAGVHEVPVIVRELDDAAALEVALIENVQRADLNALEEARGYQRLVEQFGYTQQQLAEVIGKSRSHVANTMRLLKLPEEVLELVRDGALSAGHARALVATPDPTALAKRIIKLGMSVREAEKLARQAAQDGDEAGADADGSTDAVQPAWDDAPDIRALRHDLEEALGMEVDIRKGRGEQGRLIIHWQSYEQLQETCERLMAWEPRRK